MMSRALPCVAILLVTLIACNTGERSEMELPLSQIEGFPFPIYEQQATVREWREVEVDTVATLGVADESLLYQPIGIHGRKEGGSYITDYGDYMIKKFNAVGQLVGTYGKGQGEGPGEFGNPMPVSIDEAGNVVVPDAYRRSVIRFGPAGDLLETSKLDFQPFRMVLTDDGRFYFMLSGFGEEAPMFGITNALDKPLKTFGTSSLQRLVLGGELTTTDNDLIYSPLYFGFIARFSDSGGVVYARTTMDQVDPPVLEAIEIMGVTGTRFKSRVAAKSFLAYSNGSLYMDSRPLSAERAEATVIDVYDADDGFYDYSFEVPGSWRAMDIEGNYFFALSDTMGAVLQLGF